MRQQEQIANHTYVVKRSSVNNGLPYRQQQLYEQETEEYEDVLPSLMPRSAIRYTTTQEAEPVIRSGNRHYVIHNSPPQVRAKRTTQPQDTEDEPRPRRRTHWSLVFGIGMFVMLALWILGNIAVNWWNVTQDDWHYGRPRTYQTDAVVGHEDSPSHPSHFIALNLNGKISVIEIPGGDTAHSQIYNAPTLFGAGQDLVPVTLSFEDCNGDGKPDLNIHIQGSDKIICLVNNGKTFSTTQQ